MVSESWRLYYQRYRRYFGIFFILLFLVFSLVLTTSIYDTARNEIIEQTRHELMTTAESVSISLSGDDLQKLKPGDETTPEFLRVRDEIRKFQNLSDIRYVYIMKEENGTVSFLVDADSGYDPAAAAIGEVYPNYTDSMLEGFSRPAADLEISSDRWGSFLSGYAPVRTASGEIVAMVGVDMDESQVHAKINFLDSTRLVLGLFIVILSAMGAIAMDRSRYVHEDTLTQEIELRKESERVLQESLQEKTVMLQEIHHRVNNNLQILISLINLQSRAETDPNAIEALRGCQSRIVALAVVHELLYVSKNVGSIDVRQYLERLGHSLILFYSRDRAIIPITVTAPQISLNPSTAIPVGLLMNELISNSIRHAFPDGKHGSITINVSDAGPMLKIVYTDDGCGLPADLDWNTSGSLGFRLVSSLVDQLDGSIEMIPGPGLTFRIMILKCLYEREGGCGSMKSGPPR